MSSGKKGKKTKGKPVPLGEFLGTSSPSGGNAVVLNKTSWAEESEDYEDRYTAPERFALPTAPRTARGPDVDPDSIPTSPPYTAYIANLPFEVDDLEIERFFNDLKIKSIRLPREGGENGRFKGFGYVEFETRNDLIEALSKNDDLMRNRKIRVDVAEGGDGGQRRGFSDRGSRDDDRMERSEGVSDWRAAPREAPTRDGGRDDRSPGRGGFDRRDDRYGDRDRDRGFGDRYGDRDRDRDRDRGGFGDRDRGDRYGGRYDDDRRGFRDGDSQWRRDDGPRGGGPPARDDGARTRPKLNLKPRTAPASEEKAESGAGNPGSSSIFGSARPVDTASREKEIEQKLHSKDAPAPKKESASGGGGGNIFGSAKPVDTAAREREIEEKLRKLDNKDEGRREESRREESRRDIRRDDRRGDRREDHRDEPRDIRRDEARDIRRDEPRDIRRDESTRDIRRDESTRDIRRDESTRDIRRDEPRDIRRDEPRDIRRDEPRDIRRDEPRDIRRDEPRDIRRDEPRDIRRDEPRDIRRDDHRDDHRGDRRDDRRFERRDDRDYRRDDDQRDNHRDERPFKKDNPDRREGRGNRDDRERHYDEPRRNNEIGPKGKQNKEEEIISVTNKFASLEMELED